MFHLVSRNYLSFLITLFFLEQKKKAGRGKNFIILFLLFRPIEAAFSPRKVGFPPERERGKKQRKTLSPNSHLFQFMLARATLLWEKAKILALPTDRENREEGRIKLPGGVGSGRERERVFPPAFLSSGVIYYRTKFYAWK